MDHIPLLRSFFRRHQGSWQQNQRSDDPAFDLSTYFNDMPDPCTLSKRQGQIDRQAAGAIVSCGSWGLIWPYQYSFAIYLFREV
jgi:hypothetical protein